MVNELKHKTIAFVVSNEGVEQSELTGPWEAVTRAGGRAVLVAPESGKVQAYRHLDAGGVWVDEEVQVCTGGPNVLVTSRKPDDIPAFAPAAIEVFSAGTP